MDWFHEISFRNIDMITKYKENYEIMLIEKWCVMAY